MGKWHVVGTFEENKRHPYSPSYYRVTLPEAFSLHCGEQVCNRQSLHETDDEGQQIDLERTGESCHLVFCTCKHCSRGYHAFALCFELTSSGENGQQEVRVYKFGQTPPPGGPLPKVVEKLLDSQDRELLIKGMNCERLSFGVGAMAYYRLVVEALRPRILNLILDQSHDEQMRQVLHAAMVEPRYAESFRLAKDALPPFLLHNGSNPLSMLYGLISDDLHADTFDDARALRRGKSILIIVATLLNQLQDYDKAQAAYADAIREVAESSGKRKRGNDA